MVILYQRVVLRTEYCLILTQQIFFKKNFFLNLFDLSFPGGASGRECTCQCRRQKRHGFHLWVGKIPWRRAWQPTKVFLPGKSHGQRNLVGYSPWGHKSVGQDLATKQQDLSLELQSNPLSTEKLHLGFSQVPQT